MEFGIFNSLYTPAQAVEGSDYATVEHQRIRNEVDWTVAADEAGFKYTWATEHHFLTQYSHLSSNECFLPYVAARTSNIHLGSGIINVTPPVNHPARVAERVAMIDHLSDGRFEFGMGRGSSSTEQKGFGITDPELTKEMVDETMSQFKYMWRDGLYSYDGKFFSMPPRNVLPKPYTDPHPPMWVAAGNPSTFEKAAKMGIGVLCFTTTSPEALKKLIELYKNTIEDAEPIGEYVNNNVMVTSQMICLEDGQLARDLSTRITSRLQNSMVFHYLDTFPKPEGIPDWPDVLPEPTREEIDYAIDNHLVCIGTPDEVTPSVQAYVDAGADQLVFGQLSTTIPIETAVESIHTFGKHVLPTFDKDKVHSTTRQREAYVKQRGPIKRELADVLEKVPE